MVRLVRVASIVCVYLGIAGSQSACAGSGSYVWFTEVPPEMTSERAEYLISTGDILNVRVLGHEEMNVREKVRPDGRIAIPIVGEVEARGKRPGALRAELEARLKDYINVPSVMLNVDEPQPINVVLMGEVTRPGAYPLDPTAGLAHALAMGGGLTDFASRDSIYIVRQVPTPMRIRFTYLAISRNIGRAAAFPLHAGDLIVVE
jgi:polysaccharide export outer membrane protein